MSKNLVFYKEFTWNFCVFLFHKLKKKKKNPTQKVMTDPNIHTREIEN